MTPALRHGSVAVRDAWMLLALAAASLFAFRAAWADVLVQVEAREDNGYIYLVPLTVAYLAWLRRSRLGFVRHRPSLLGVLIALAGGALAWWGGETDTRAAAHLGAVLGLVAVPVSVYGFEIVRRFQPAFLAMLFLIPVPGEVRRWIAGPLQELAVIVTQEMLDLAGVGVERQGFVLVIARKPILVGEACDGLRMVLALALTFFVFVFSVPLRRSARIVLLAASPMIAIVCNVVRLVPTGLAYAYASPDAAESFHDIAGWLMLPLAIVALGSLIRLMRWMDLPVYTWRFLQA